MSHTSRRPLSAAFAFALAVTAAPAASAAPSTDSLMPRDPACSVDAGRLAAETPGPFPGVGWTVGQVGDPCGNLGYVFLETAGGTGSSPTRVVLFHRGQKTATQPPADRRVQLGGHSDFHVTLSVKNAPKEGQSNADTGFTPTLYVWNPLTSDVAPVPGIGF